MAFAITNKVINVAPNWHGFTRSTSEQYLSTTTTTSTTAKGKYFEFGDYTSTQTIPASSQSGSIAGGFGDFAVPARNFRALIYLKALTSTSTTGSLTVKLEAATSTGFSPAVPIDSKILDGTSTSACLTLWGTCPVSSQDMQYARITFTMNGSTSGGTNASTWASAVDAIIEAI